MQDRNEEVTKVIFLAELEKHVPGVFKLLKQQNFVTFSFFFSLTDGKRELETNKK